MIKKLIAILFTLIVAGCVQAISTRDLDKKEAIPSISYEAYFFAAGISDRSRAVFLVKPESGVRVKADSDDITSTTASYAEALAFMREKKEARTISTQVVLYSGKPIGYLLSYDRPGTNMERVNISLTERNGVVYFRVREIEPTDD
jgi:hypothetical protein